MDRHDGKQLAERPVIKQRLKHRKIANVLIAQGRFELLYFVGYVAQAAMHVDDLMRDLPVNGVDLRFGFEIQQAKIERLLRFLLYLLNVVKAFQPISTLQTLFHVQDVAHQFMIFLCDFDFEFRRSFLDRAKRFEHQHGMVRDNGAPAFTYNDRM